MVASWARSALPSQAMAVDASPLLSVLAVEAIVMVALALLYGSIWWRTREPGMPALAAGFLLCAAWYALADRIGPGGPSLATAAQRVGAVAIGTAVVLITVGVVQYLGMPRGRLRLLIVACWASAGVMTAVVALTPDVPQRVFHIGVLVSYLGAAVVAFRRAAQQPGDGHGLLGLSLLSLPVTPVAMLAAGVHPGQLKYFAGASVVVFGLILLTVSLLRRQRLLGIEVRRRSAAEEQLRKANVRLEARVQERTAHLHELINGLETFNRSVSHDLRGPLGGMSNLARMAADALGRGDHSMADRVLPMIATQCDASVDMVNAMLELARLGDAPVRRERVCLADVVRSAFDEVMLGRAHGPGPAPALRVAQMPEASADPRLLRAIFVNLLGNALKFSREAAAPCIGVEAAAEGRELTVSVADNGVGFDAGMAERLFEPFYRAHGQRFEGHGLGLSIVRRAVEALGGRVWARTLPQGGASISFTLPDALQVQAERAAEPAGAF